MQQDLEKRIKHEEELFTKSIPDHSSLIELSKECLSTRVDQRTIHAILDIGHLQNVSRYIANENLTDKWFDILSMLIKKSNYHIGYMLDQRSNRYSNDIAINIVNKGKVKSLSYLTLWSLIKEVGRSLSVFEQDQQKPIIGILSHNQLNCTLVDLACLAFGFKVVPIPLNATSEHVSFILEHSEITHLFLGGKKGNDIWSDIIDRSLIKTIAMDESIKINESLDWEQFLEIGDQSITFNVDEKMNSVNINDTQSIMYTSGTTDNPKGIMFSQFNMISKRFSRALALPDIGSNDIFLCYLPLYHTFGRYFEMMGSLFWGATYSFAASPAFNSLLNDFKIIRPTIFISIPKRWVQLYDILDSALDLGSDPKEDIKKQLNKITGGDLKWGLSAAGFLDSDIFSFFHDQGIKLLSGYGMTEATGGITMTPPHDYQPSSVGKALPGIELKLEEDGELCIQGPYVAEGYFKDDDSKVFVNGWFHTEDIFEENDGHYFIIDRKKDIYKNSRGQTIAPQKIENLFQDFESIKTVFLVGDGKEFNTVLIYPNFGNENIAGYKGKTSEIRELFSSMILSVNSFLSPFERIVNYVVINRDFSEKNGELTPKGTFKRKRIIKNFEEIIAPLYEKNYTSLRYNNKEIRIPKWVIREIGTLDRNISWDGKTISIHDSSKALSMSWNDNSVQLGDFSYTFENDILDLNTFIQSPNLWLGNFGFTEFIGTTIFRLRETKSFDGMLFEKVVSSSMVNANSNQKVADNALYDIHRSVRLYIDGDVSSFEILRNVIDGGLGNWSTVLTDALMNFRYHSNPTFRTKLIDTIAPILSGDLFVELLEDSYKYHLKHNPRKGFSFIIKRISDEHFQCLIKYLRNSENEVNNSGSINDNFIKTLLLLVADFGILHPTRFTWARSELISWQLNKAPKPIHSTAQKAYYSLVKGFRSWIGHSPGIGVDRETGEEYHWKDVINFDQSIRQKHRDIILKAVQETSLIKESLFLFSNNYLVDLNEIPKNGIWITFLGSQNNKNVFRLIVQTRNFGNHNLVINLNEGFERDFIEDETKWLIKMGAGFRGKALSENFGGYWPEHNLYTEEYIQGETLDDYLKRNKEDIKDKARVDRWQMRWLHFIWSGVQAYQEFWERTNLQLSIQPPSPKNLIIPQHDYKDGSRLISISSRKPVKSLTEHFLSLYTEYIVSTEKKYPGLNHMSDWEVIFTATIQALKVKKGKKVLENLKDEIESSNIAKECELIGLTKDRINQFLDEILNLGVLTKPVVFASLRYERWLDLNPDATMKAKSSILQDLYKDYDLNSLLDEYPETRVRFFMMTCFKESSAELYNEFKTLIKDLRRRDISPWNLQERMSDIQLKIHLNEEEKFFFARMLFPNVDSADYIELVATTHGHEARLNLVTQTECKDGKIYRIRPPFLPKEIARFHSILTESSLSVTFTSSHEFLLTFNNRNRLTGGLYWKRLENNRVHLEWVVIRKKYQKIELSKRLMSDFFDRMNHDGIGIITVGFYAQKFFAKHGFKIEKQHGGMVKRLQTVG